MHSDSNLYDRLNSTLIEIERQLEDVVEQARASVAVGPYPDNRTIYGLRTRDGKPVLTELLAAKAQCLSAMVALKGMKK